MKFLPVREANQCFGNRGGIEIMIFMISITKIDYFDTAAVTSPIDKMPTIPVLINFVNLIIIYRTYTTSSFNSISPQTRKCKL